MTSSPPPTVPTTGSARLAPNGGTAAGRLTPVQQGSASRILQPGRT